MTTGRINQVAPSMTPARMSPPGASGGVNTRTTVVRFQRRTLDWASASTAWKHARTMFCIPEHSQRPQPRPHAHGGAMRVDDSPSPNGPRDTPRGIERKITSLGSKLPSQGMQHRKPSFAQGLPAPGSSPEEDRAWTVHRSSGEPANTNDPNVTHAPPRVPAGMRPACPLAYGT